ncbi:MAG: G-D-S-L family lipolytic protein [Acaryochloridaceae cyanobacterium RU_4_10]|nr:G-D-S-L family lipolytic protein [Acaryochloridaceae cyanobacterium RU_4_10]
MSSVSSSLDRQTGPIQKPHIPLKVVALGDSLIYGYGDTVGGGWVERLRREWLSPERPGPILYNLGVRGDTIQHVSQRLEFEFQQRGELRNRRPDRLILSVGVNDSVRLGRSTGRHLVDFEDFQATLAQILDRTSQLCPTLFIGMVPVNESKMPFLDALYFSQEDQYLYKEATRLACQERNIPYLDTFEIWRQRGTSWYQAQLCGDGLHPNVEGYQALLADIVAWQPLQNVLTNAPMPCLTF